MNVLIVTTNCSMLAPDQPTGLWFEEFAVPFTAFSEAGASIRVVSPKGGDVPIDPKTAPTEKDREKWPVALQALTSTGRLAEVAADRFDAVFVPGGHGPMVDLVNDQDLQRLLAAFDRDGKIIAAVCHGLVCAAERAECGGRASGQRAEGHRLHQDRGALGHAARRGVLLARRCLEGTRCELRIRSPAVFLPCRARREPDHWPEPRLEHQDRRGVAPVEEGSSLTG